MPMTRSPYPLTGIQDTGGGLDPQLQQLLDLIQAQQPPPGPPPVEPPPQVPGWQQALLGGTPKNFIGGLGDAISAMAAVRAGGLPPQVGGYASMKQRKAESDRLAMQDYQDRLAQQSEKNSDFRNQAILSDFERQQMLAGQKELAAMKGGPESEYSPRERTGSIGGVSHRFITWYDKHGQPVPTPHPQTGVVELEHDLGEAGYAPFIQPAIPGVSPPTRISKSGPEGPVKGGVTPPPPPGTAEKAGTALTMRVLAKDALKSYEDYIPTTSRATRSITSLGRQVPMIGGAIEEGVLSYTDPRGVEVARKIDNVADMLLRLRSGAQINDKEFLRLRSLLPKLGENPVTALGNFRRFDTELLTTLRLARARAPALFTPELLQDLGLDESDLGGPANRPDQPAAAQAQPQQMSPEENAYRNYLKSLGVEEGEDGETP